MHAQLLQEPWCFTIDQVKRLTRWQVVELYLRPAARRSAAMKGSGDAPTEGLNLDDLEAFVATMTEQFGGDREKWESDWNKLKIMERERG